MPPTLDVSDFVVLVLFTIVVGVIIVNMVNNWRKA